MTLLRYIKKFTIRRLAHLLVSGRQNYMSDVLAMLLLFILDLTHKQNPLKTLPRRKELINFLEDLAEKVLQDDSSQDYQGGLTKIHQPIQRNDRQLVFLDCHIEDSLTSNIIRNLFESARMHSGITSIYLNLARVPVNKRLEVLQSSLRDSTTQYYIIFEIHVGIGESKKTLHPNMFSEINNSLNIKVVPISFDLYRPFDEAFVTLWSPRCAAIIHLDPASARKFEVNTRMIFWPFVFTSQKAIVSQEIEPNQNSLRNTILFQGSINSQSRVRHLLLLSTWSKRLKLDIRIFQSNMQNLENSIEQQAHYYQDLSNALAVINFNEKRKSTHSVITFRALETLSLGGCLLEQESPQHSSQLSNLAVPYQHYLPFESPKDLTILCWSLSRKPEIAEQIKTNAKKHWEHYYSEVKLWSELMDSLESL